MWDLIVSVPDHCLSFYFTCISRDNISKMRGIGEQRQFWGNREHTKSRF